ncbi:related to histone-lysine N-methyltransferase [Rhynchosporium graminicola]|uniref:Related to histone-lysine N-methyltransferase n=1 Tax=Rhynchosporium graminicola TaxID=2792576 RepID=A0A1E1KQV2_9HELO|nr:related to histone-lysine N-methyltransferase [Rhynchosporium commune]
MSVPNSAEAGAQEQASTPAAQDLPVAMQQQTATPQTTTTSPAQAIDPSRDVIMTDIMSERPASPAILPGATLANHIPTRTATPSRNTNGSDNTSRAASLHPDPTPAMPKEAPPHGAPTRQYLNSKVTGPLMDGMKLLAKDQPKDPLRVLGEYLLQRSREVEGS